MGLAEWIIDEYTCLVTIYFSEIRHPEELSLCKPVEEEHLKFNYGDFRRQQQEKRRRVTLGPTTPQHSAHRHATSTTSLLELSSTPTVNNRPDTNTFIANSSNTLNRKVSTLSWHNGTSSGGTMGSRFRSLGRNGTFDTPIRRRSEHTGPHNVRL